MPFKTLLTSPRVWSCNNCATHISNHEAIVSKTFHGRHGRAYLVKNVINVGVAKQEERRLLTGIHVVADIYCNVCRSVLGWKYVRAHTEKEKYKEGKFLLEKAKVMKDNAWESK